VSERLSVLVLTEDTGDDTYKTISAVAKKLLLLLEPGLDERRLHFARAGVDLCENVRRFNEEVRARVEALLLRRGRTSALERLALLVPFWSVESWLFQNTSEALRICQEHHPRYAYAAPGPVVRGDADARRPSGPARGVDRDLA